MRPPRGSKILFTDGVHLPIRRSTRAKLEAYCALHGLPNPDAVADKILNDTLNDLAHEDLIDVEHDPLLPSPPHLAGAYDSQHFLADQARAKAKP